MSASAASGGIVTWTLSDSPSQLLAHEGWLGCPHCERPINARLLMLDGQRRLLRTVLRKLEEAGVRGGPAVKVIAGELSDLEETKADVEDEFYPRITYGESLR